MIDPISDMLTRIRNAQRALLPVVEVPHSKMKESIAHILKQEGYVAEVAVEGKPMKKLKLKIQGDDFCVVPTVCQHVGAVQKDAAGKLIGRTSDGAGIALAGAARTTRALGRTAPSASRESTRLVTGGPPA